jgi:hypothetical protein
MDTRVILHDPAILKKHPSIDHHGQAYDPTSSRTSIGQIDTRTFATYNFSLDSRISGEHHEGFLFLTDHSKALVGTMA